MILRGYDIYFLYWEYKIKCVSRRYKIFSYSLFIWRNMTIPKRSKYLASIEDKVLSMCAKVMSQRDIVSTREDIYGFEISNETIFKITDSVIEYVGQLQNRYLKKFYTFIFVDCIYIKTTK